MGNDCIISAQISSSSTYGHSQLKTGHPVRSAIHKQLNGRLPENDHNAYNLGSVFNHNVVIAGLPTTGNCSAATVVAQMRNTYPRLRFGLLVGIGGGVPTHTDAGPIRLGHIVVSQPVGQHSGAVQYDHGKAEANDFVRTGFLTPPPMVLLNAARELQVSRRRASFDPLISHLERIDTTKRGLRNFKRPKAGQDHLYEPEYIHLEKGKSCKKCGCDASKRVDRDVDDSDDDSTSETDDNWLVIHRGTIASGEVVMRDGLHRDALAGDHKILCFEMEAAGALNDFPCLVIRGISDYSDSHKNDKWHGYAAAVAAAYARELFQRMPIEEVKQCKIAEIDVERLVQNTQESADYILDSRVKDWLRPPDASINLLDASKLRHSDTGRWFLESDRYHWLKSTPGASLWLRGIPGCGKTVLSSTIIKDLELINRTTGTAIVYFFFSFSDESKQTLDYMLRSFIHQLIGWDKSTFTHLLKLFETSRHGHEQPQTIQLVEVFNQMVSGSQDLIVVIDALDESKDRRDLLRWITSSSGRTYRFILTSRAERDIEEFFASWLSPNGIITLESDLVGDDIEAYVHYRLEEEEHLSRWKSMHEEITSTFLKKAAGMFRWVYCQLQELSECLDKAAVRRMLQALPHDLNETYDRILQNIPRSRVPNAIKLLQLLTFSIRPLKLEEVADALATEPDMEQPFDTENRISPPGAVIAYCANLVMITTAHEGGLVDVFRDTNERWSLEHDSSAEAQLGERIRLAHFSVREYLLLGRKETPYYGCFDERVAHAAITRIFLGYLWTAAETLDIRENVSGNPLIDLRRFPLIGLAAHHWMDHATIAGEDEEATFAWTRKAFTTQSFLQYWTRHFNPMRCPNSVPALYYASDFALHRSVKYLLGMHADPNAKGGLYGNALQAASTSDSVQIVQLLLDHGASVNAQGGYCGSALHAAAWYGRVNTLQLLLTNGADLGSLRWQEGSAAPALQLAADRGHTEIVEALLEHGTDVNARNLHDTFGRRGHNHATAHYTALEAASYMGHIEVVKILLHNNAEIDARGPYSYGQFRVSYEHGTPLQAASIMGHLDIVRILVESGADVNIESGCYGYALHAALSEAHTKVSLFLIQSGANIHAQGGFFVTSLHAAVLAGDLMMVQLLIENGVDINQSDHVGDNALTRACKRGSTQIARLLLDNGADVNSRGEQNFTALHIASCLGHVEVVRLLLDNGADVSAQGGRSYMTLYAAYKKGLGVSKEIMQALLDNGADPNARDDGDRTLLLMACCDEELAVATMLLSYGADPNVQCGEFGTALIAASYNGSTMLVQTLLDNGANVNSQGGRYGDALQSSCCPESHVIDPDLVQLLLHNGASINAQSGEYGTALCAACCKGDLEIVNLLIREGANVNAHGGKYYDCALCAAAYKGHMDVVRVLLENGAVAGPPADPYKHALRDAIGEGRKDIAELLFEAGAKEELTRASSYPGLKRSASDSDMW
ncbi:Pfs, NACHT and ankyrin domain protein, partial [Aureobasidium melanogenum]